MGISICIPVFNYNVTELVNELYKQSKTIDIPVEIIVADDASTNKGIVERNRHVANYENVKLLELSENYGRSKIRNYLAKTAQYEHLLFVDADTFPVSRSFIGKYASLMNLCPVVVGGITYRPEKPSDEFLLRWHYGHRREKIKLNKRLKNPYRSFMTGNFFINRKVFNEIAFDETIKLYGHEDTLFGIDLKTKGYEIKHIDNQVYHIGLETNSQFLEKTRISIDNLIQLRKRSKNNSIWVNEIKLLRYYNIVKRFGMNVLTRRLFTRYEKSIINKLSARWPFLIWFDIYKLGYLCKANGKRHRE